MHNMDEKVKFVFAALFGQQHKFAQSILGPQGREMAKAVWEAAERTQNLFGGWVAEHVERTFAPEVPVQMPVCPAQIDDLKKMSEAVRSLTQAKGELRHAFLTEKFLREERKTQFALSKLG